MKEEETKEGKKRRIRKLTVLETNRNGAWYEKNQRKRGERGVLQSKVETVSSEEEK